MEGNPAEFLVMYLSRLIVAKYSKVLLLDAAWILETIVCSGLSMENFG